MTVVERFLILESGAPRPDAERIIFCDGAGGGMFRDGSDLDLSHWRPNRTPGRYRAGTSTEICFRFLDDPLPGRWTVAVNNHLDVDGILSVFTLVHSAAALARRREIISAAEMGDFWGWGEPPAQRLFQGLTRWMAAGSESGLAAQDIYAEAFRRTPAWLDGSDPELPAIDESLAPLREGVAQVERGQIVRMTCGDRLAHYLLPERLSCGRLERALYVPGFNEAISTAALFWPQVRARRDAERVCLVSVELPAGWRHDVWFPGYLWADTEGLWRTPGVDFGNGMEVYELTNERLIDAALTLQRAESAPGEWSLAHEQFTWHRQMGGAFPVGMRFLNADGAPTASGHSPEAVAAALAPVFGST